MRRLVTPFVLLLVIAAVIAAAYIYLSQSPTQDASGDETSSDPGEENAESLTLVTLNPSAVRSADLVISGATFQEIAPYRIIAGRLDFDQTKHVGINTACQGIAKEIFVLPGQRVEAGDIVAVISSPQIGAARSEITQRRAELELAEKRRSWTGEIREGVNRLVSMIRASATPEQIEKSLKDVTLGQYRERLVTAYSRRRLANRLDSSIRDAVASGAVTGRLQSERESELQASEAALMATLEQAVFDVEQAYLQDEATAEKAARELQISLESLQLLLGPWASPIDQPDAGNPSDDSLSTVNLVSPIAGIIQEQLVSTFERVEAGQAVLVVADTESLWAVAEVREKDWAVADIGVGDRVEISTPLIPDQSFSGSVLIIGPSVNAKTGAMPLVATVSAEDQRLKPGMFVRMKVQAGTTRRVLAVPETAIVLHEGTRFVFIPETDHSFRRVDVEIGLSQDGVTEIVSGISENTSVVSQGVFKLQSELLLAAEEE